MHQRRTGPVSQRLKWVLLTIITNARGNTTPHRITHLHPTRPVEERRELITKKETPDLRENHPDKTMKMGNHVATTPDRVGLLGPALPLVRVDQDTTNLFKGRARQYRVAVFRPLKMHRHLRQEEQSMLLTLVVIR